jgi:NitT/TauT family transport system permease protein
VSARGAAGGARVPAAAALLPLLVLWEVVGRADVALFVPPLTRVLAAWWTIAANGTLWKALAPSLLSLLYGFGLALAVGAPLGILMGRYRGVQYVFDPYVNALTSAPLSALVPLLIALFGVRDTVVTATVFLFAVGVIVVNTVTGVKGADRSVLEMARSFGATELQVYGKILLPAALPAMMTGAHLGAMQAVKGMVVGEMLVALIGLGERLIYYGNTFLFPQLYAVILTVVALALLAAQIVHLADRTWIRWK